MPEDLPDYAADSPSVAKLSSEKMDQLGKAAENQIKVEQEILALEMQIENHERQLSFLRGKVIPELLDSMGIRDIGLKDGSSLNLVNLYQVGISEAKKEAAHKWLEDNGFGSLIKKTCVVVLERENTEGLSSLTKWLKENLFEFQVEETINHNTLKSFVKGQLEAPVEDNAIKPPDDLFGIFVVKQATIKNKENKAVKRKYEKKK